MKNKFTISFDFTTVRGNHFVGRNGEVDIETDKSLSEVKDDIKLLGNLCEQAIHNKNPKWNIFHIEITNIEPLEKEYDENDLINDLY